MSSSRVSSPVRRALVAVLGVAVLAAVAACSSSSKSDTASAGSGNAASAAPVTVRLGYFPNITHAPAIVGVEKGFFQQALGQNKLETATFNAGPEAIDALFADSIDAAFVGPEPGGQRLPEVERRGDSHRLRLHIGRRVWSSSRPSRARPT